MGDTPLLWNSYLRAAPLSINAILPICEGLVAARMTLRAVVNTSHPHIPETHQEKMSLHYNDRFIDDDIKLYKHQHGAALFLMAASIANHFSSKTSMQSIELHNSCLASFFVWSTTKSFFFLIKAMCSLVGFMRVMYCFMILSTNFLQCFAS